MSEQLPFTPGPYDVRVQTPKSVFYVRAVQRGESLGAHEVGVGSPGALFEILIAVGAEMVGALRATESPGGLEARRASLVRRSLGRGILASRVLP